jgi:predicted nucleic acid-binding protein
MYLLDTNVISELRKAASGKADKKVISWANTIPSNSLFMSVISLLEIERGILQLERKDTVQGAILRTWLNNHVLPAFNNRILPIDTAVAQRCAKLHIPNPGPERDSMIAATALVHGMTVVTRNTADFNISGLDLINPWNFKTPK